MNKQKQKIMAVLLIVAMLFTLVPAPVFAADKTTTGAEQTVLDISKGSITIGEDNVSGCDSNGNQVTTPNPYGYIITGNNGSDNDKRVTITNGSHNILIRDLFITVDDFSDSAAFCMSGGGTLNLTLEGTNTLHSGAGKAGLSMENGSSLNITTASDSVGTLNAKSRSLAPGIGSNQGGKCGNISITGGNFCINKDGAHGIAIGAGASDYAECGTVSITGGHFAEGSVTENKIYGVEVPSGNYVINDGTTCFPYTVTNVKPDNHNKDGLLTILDVSKGNVVIGDGILDAKDSEGKSLTTYDADGFKIVGTTTTNTVSITGGSHNITIENLSIDVSNKKEGDYTYFPAFNMAGGGHLKLTLSGTNTLSSGKNYAGLNLTEGSFLTITADSGNNTLNANGGENAPSIGSGKGQDCGNILIEGGSITAKAGFVSTSIGPGSEGNCGNITIIGGSVKAQGYGNYTSNSGTNYVYGGIGNVYSQTAPNGRCGIISITGGTISADRIGSMPQIEFADSEEKRCYETIINISGGNIKVEKLGYKTEEHTGISENSISITITGGNFSSGVIATVGNSGSVYDCTVAQCHKVENDNINTAYSYKVVAEHTEATITAKEPTCTETGLTEGKHCSVCNEVLIPQTEVEKLSHTEVIDVAVPATCTATGLTEGKHCSVCGTVIVEQQKITKLSHTEVVDAAKTPTCTETGLTEGKHCSVCNEVLVAQTVVAMLEHTYGSDNICAVCGDKKASTSTGGGGFSGSYNYPVSTPTVDNGSVKLSDNNASAGETVTATVKPDNGYGVAEVIVTDEKGNVILVTYLGNGEYSFVMPIGKVSIETVCKPAITLTIGSQMANVFGKNVKNDVAPIITAEGRTMLPIRFIAEALGADVSWNAATQTVTITKDGVTVQIIIGADYAYINGKKVKLDAKAFIANGRTYQPVRFIVEALGVDVNWDAATKQVVIMK